MEITVFTEREKYTTKVNFSGKTVKELLLQLNINSETILVIRKNEVLTEDEVLQKGDQISLLSVISGG